MMKNHISVDFTVKILYNHIMETYIFPLKTFDCFWRETSKDIIEKEVLTMSEKAQEVRKRRLESMEYLRERAEIAFDFVLNELDEKTSKGDYSPFSLFITCSGTPCTSLEPNFAKKCDEANIGEQYHKLFFTLLEKMFNDEEGFTAKFIHGCNKVDKLIVKIDFV